MGHIYADILDADGKNVIAGSIEIFGNHTDAYVMSEDGSDFSAFAGKAVRLRFRMLDAKLYSFKFEN